MSEATPFRILVVEDDPAMARMLRTLLAARGFMHVEHVMTGHGATDAGGRADLVLLDHHLPDITGIEVLESLRAQSEPPSVIMVTAHGNESLAAAALRQGADDYLVKDESLTELLPQVIERVRRVRALGQALDAAERELVRTERLAAIGEMSVTLHHEINNPLMATLAEVDMLLAGGSLVRADRDAVGRMREGLLRIRDIVRRSADMKQARSTTYVGGTRMIDLSATDDGIAPPSLGPAAVYVADEDLARVLGLLLRQAGFQVRRTHSPAALEAESSAPGIRLVVLAASTGADPFGGFHPSAARGYRVVALVPDDGAAALGAGADHVVRLPFDPATLGAELAELI